MMQLQQKLQLTAPPNQPHPTQLPAQQVSNYNNKTIQSAHNIGLVTYPIFPTCCIAPELMQEIFVPVL